MKLMTVVFIYKKKKKIKYTNGDEKQKQNVFFFIRNCI